MKMQNLDYKIYVLSFLRFFDNCIYLSAIFSQKGLHPPTPLPPTRQKAAAFSLLGGSASHSPLLAKNRHSHYCSFKTDFLHHEAGEIKGASHGLDFILDCHDSASQNLAMTENIADSANRRISHENAKFNTKITHPLTPSASEGEFLDSNSAREGEQIAESAPFSQNLANKAYKGLLK
ncbi:hypothetical protein ACWIUD_02645 [Helicobacter sp. 23-1044]